MTPSDTDFESRCRVIAETWHPSAHVERGDPTCERVTAFAALLDQADPVEAPKSTVPPLWHWFLFGTYEPQSELGPDGHPTSGPTIPPLGPRRRVFGGGRLTVNAALHWGEPVRRTRSVEDVRFRLGSSGPLLLVTERHVVSVDGQDRVIDEQDIVYLPPAEPLEEVGDTAASRAEDLGAVAPNRDWSLQITPDPVLLFRFSALTRNAHRIHYDLPYARAVEGHAGLVVHGPLLALLMLELPRRQAPDRTLRKFSWRAVRPLHAGEQLTAYAWKCGKDGAEVGVTSASGVEAVSGTISFMPNAIGYV